MSLIVDNILDLIEIGGEDVIKKELSAFCCPQNEEIEDFLKNKSIEFAKQKLSITYIVRDEKDFTIVGYYTLTIRAVEIASKSVSKTLNKRIQKFAIYDDKNDTYTVAAYLLAQFGKNYGIDNGSRIKGDLLMDSVESTIRYIQHMIGVGLVYLDVEKNNKTAIDLYMSKSHYIKFDERKSASDGKEYDIMIKAI